MNKIFTILAVLILILGISGISAAQHDQMPQTAPPQSSTPSGTGAAGGMMGEGGMNMMAMMQTMHPSIAVDGNAVYIVRGSQVLKLDKNSLRVIATGTLPDPPGMHAGMGGMPAEGGQGMMQHPDMQGMMDSMSKAPSNQFDQMFLQNMTHHHVGAIEMSRLALNKASHPELRRFAQKVINDQARENRQFASWMKSWYKKSIQPSVMPMDRNNVNQLKSLEGREFEIEYMQMMIHHHQSGIQMAQMAQQRAVHPELKTAASKIVTAQSAEIIQLKNWLSRWYNIKG
ncbi:MAG: DUF305 domain-containing protein [Armatimonadota bacterium]